jgi:signal transduction histidine kinase
MITVTSTGKKLFLLLNALFFLFVIVNFYIENVTLQIILSITTALVGSFILSRFLLKYTDRYNELYKLNERLKSELSEKNYQIEYLNISFKERVNEVINNLQKKEELLQYKPRYVQINEIISMIAHQWRQPLSMISAAVFSIRVKTKRKKFDLSTQQGQIDHIRYLEKNLSEIEEQVQFLSSTINNFRNFFEPEKLKENTTLQSIISNALNIIEIPLRENSIDIKKDFNSVNTINVFKNEVTQVIINILSNAQDNFLNRNISGAEILIHTYDKNTSAILEISDNGGGIEDDIFKEIFDPYFSTKEDKNGTGLGLYISKKIIENHNSGQIDAQNRDGGVVFTIVFNA